MSLIVEEDPYVAVVEEEFLDSVCSSCFTVKNRGTLQRCAKCKTVHYCSRECQKKDWTIHKDECAGFVRGRLLFKLGVTTTLYRTLSRVITRYRRGDHTKVRSFNGRCFDDLMDHYEEIIYGPYGKRKKIDIVINQFGIYQKHQVIGAGVYLGCSALDHSCSPTTFMTFRGSMAMLRSPKAGVVFNDRQTVSYTNLLQTTTERKAKLLDNFYFNCDCTACMDTKTDGYARSIRCKSCSDGICLVLEKESVIKCETCSAVSDVGIKQVEAAEQHITAQLEWATANRETLKYDPLVLCIALYRKLAPLLSHLNLKLAMLARKIAELSIVEVPSSPYAAEFADKFVPAFKRLLRDVPTSCFELTEVLNVAACGALTTTPPSRKALKMIQEARDSCVLALGPDHPTTAMNCRSAAVYEMRLSPH